MGFNWEFGELVGVFSCREVCWYAACQFGSVVVGCSRWLDTVGANGNGVFSVGSESWVFRKVSGE